MEPPRPWPIFCTPACYVPWFWGRCMILGNALGRDPPRFARSGLSGGYMDAPALRHVWRLQAGDRGRDGLLSLSGVFRGLQGQSHRARLHEVCASPARTTRQTFISPNALRTDAAREAAKAPAAHPPTSTMVQSYTVAYHSISPVCDSRARANIVRSWAMPTATERNPENPPTFRRQTDAYIAGCLHFLRFVR
jgi:hypothetical protein